MQTILSFRKVITYKVFGIKPENEFYKLEKSKLMRLKIPYIQIKPLSFWLPVLDCLFQII